MGVGTTGLEQRMHLFKQSQEYRLLIESIYLSLNQGTELGTIVDTVIRPIAKDISSMGVGNIILHIWINPPLESQ